MTISDGAGKQARRSAVEGSGNRFRALAPGRGRGWHAGDGAGNRQRSGSLR